MICWAVRNGVPFNAAYDMTLWQLKAYAIIFSQFENGGLEYDWDEERFIERT